MDSVTDICKYQFLCFVTIIQVKVISGQQVKKVKPKNWIWSCNTCFWVRSSQRTRKMTLKHFLKRQNRSKVKMSKMSNNSRNDVKRILYILGHISAIF